jgi:hypothetical protein
LNWKLLWNQAFAMQQEAVKVNNVRGFFWAYMDMKFYESMAEKEAYENLSRP